MQHKGALSLSLRYTEGSCAEGLNARQMHNCLACLVSGCRPTVPIGVRCCAAQELEPNGLGEPPKDGPALEPAPLTPLPSPLHSQLVAVLDAVEG